MAFGANDGMFPSVLRKEPSSLREHSENAVVRLILTFVNRSSNTFYRNVTRVRRFICRNLVGHLKSVLLSKIVPYYDPKQETGSLTAWNFPCLTSEDRVRCRMHKECEVTWNRCSRIIEILFSFDTDQLRLNFKRISADDQGNVIRRVLDVVQQPAPKGRYIRHGNHMPQLKDLVLSGGTVHVDVHLAFFESLSEALFKHAQLLTNLQFPVASNYVMYWLSDHPTLEKLHVERTRHFSFKGLQHLSRLKAKTRKNLKVLRIGMVREGSVYVSDVALFLQRMQSLISFSLGDENRQLIFGNNSLFKFESNNVFVYSSLKLSVVDFALGQMDSSARLPRNAAFKTNLETLKVVDRQLKPRYLIDATPHLKCLCIDWQEELCQLPFSRYKRSWFSEMLQRKDWQTLAKNLQSLEVAFPSALEPNAYSLPLRDSDRLMRSCENLSLLKLTGVGINSAPVSLLHILRCCQHLRKLTLEACVVDFDGSFDSTCVHANLQAFRYTTKALDGSITETVATYMPNLKELVMQPSELSARFHGLLPRNVSDLSALRRLERASIPLAFHSFVMNMPEMVCVLSNFDSLRNLVLSWGATEENYTFTDKRILYMTRWLSSALIAENVNIVVELCFKAHQPIYYRSELSTQS